MLSVKKRLIGIKFLKGRRVQFLFMQASGLNIYQCLLEPGYYRNKFIAELAYEKRGNCRFPLKLD
jgi:hypothetical protein